MGLESSTECIPQTPKVINVHLEKKNLGKVTRVSSRLLQIPMNITFLVEPVVPWGSKRKANPMSILHMVKDES